MAGNIAKRSLALLRALLSAVVVSGEFRFKPFGHVDDGDGAPARRQHSRERRNKVGRAFKAWAGVTTESTSGNEKSHHGHQVMPTEVFTLGQGRAYWSAPFGSRFRWSPFLGR